MRRRDFFRVCGGAAVVAAVATSCSPRIPAPKPVSYPLGKLPAAKPAVKLSFKDYINLKEFPGPPPEFGRARSVPEWQMLGNDNIGDCAIAGPLHSLMLWHAETGVPLSVDTPCAVRNYSELTGYNPALTDIFGNNPTDVGCTVADMAEYWRTNGMWDAKGNRHTIDAYLALEPGNIDELWMALYLFDGLGIGLSFPESWMIDFRHGVAWDAVHEQSVGGHYVTATGRTNGCINLVTWGKNQLMTTAAYQQRNDETYIFLNKERFLKSGLDINGFNYNQLVDDMLDLALIPNAYKGEVKVTK